MKVLFELTKQLHIITLRGLALYNCNSITPFLDDLLQLIATETSAFEFLTIDPHSHDPE
jgi:hypothetical protein